MQQDGNDRKSVMMFITSMLIFGTNGIFRKFIPVSSAFLAFSRGILGGLFMLAYTKILKKTAKEKLPCTIAVLLAVTGAVLSVNWILLFEAYNHTTVAVATLCYYMQPTIVMLLSPLLFNEKLTLKKGICAIAAIAGMVLVSGVIDGKAAERGDISGVLLGLGAAVLYSAVVIMNKIISGVDVYQKTTIQLFSAGIIMIPYMLLTGGFGSERFDLVTVILIVIVGVVHTGIAYVLYFGSMDGMKAQSVAILSYIDPVSSVLLSALILKEPLNVAGIIGAIMIIGSAIICEMQIESQ